MLRKKELLFWNYQEDIGASSKVCLKLYRISCGELRFSAVFSFSQKYEYTGLKLSWMLLFRIMDIAYVNNFYRLFYFLVDIYPNTLETKRNYQKTQSLGVHIKLNLAKLFKRS